MIQLQRAKKILWLSIPIIGGMISQNLLNLVDTAMVGQLGASALAAVGVASFAVFMSNAIVLGLSSGVQAVASRRVGEGRLSHAGVPLLSGLIIALLLGVLITLLLYPIVPQLFAALNDDATVREMGSAYWRIRLFATVFMGMAYAFRGYFNGIGQPKYYLQSLVAIHILNVLLNYLFIFGNAGFPAMGTDGAALASTIATVVGTLFYFYLSVFKLKHLNIFKVLPSRSDIVSVLKLTLPSGAQQFMIAASMSSLFWIVGHLGVVQVAALNILINILMLCVLPGFGFGMAAATLVGTSLGEQSPAQAKRWAYDVALMGGMTTLSLSLIIIIFAQPILEVFTHDQATIEAALTPLMLTGGLVFLDVMGVVMMNSLLGSGDVKIVLKTNLMSQWLLFFPAGLALVFIADASFITVWLMFIFSRLLQGLIYWREWHLERWGKLVL